MKRPGGGLYERGKLPGKRGGRMKTKREYPAFILTDKGARWVGTGHPWVYAAEVTRAEGQWENGDMADVLDAKGRYLGTGFVSAESKIRVRIVSRNANDRFDRDFWERRVRYAWQYRRSVMGPDTGCCRVIFGEADGFPGLTVDRFENLLSVQIASVGMERRQDEILPLIVKVLREDGQRIDGVFLRNDLSTRALEGLPEFKGWYPLPGEPAPESAVTRITENGVTYLVDVENGQKTGFFLDQKYNRLAVRRIAAGRNVLDLFTHTGSFALNAALGGAQRVTAVDVSAPALELARENARLSGLEGKVEFVCADVFELLTQLWDTSRRAYDLIILDPPAFTKSRRTADSAYRGYREINYRAMGLLPRGGFLATASCSHFMPEADFRRMLRESARDAGRELREIEVRKQAPDHPILWNVPETEYLKFFLFQVV